MPRVSGSDAEIAALAVYLRSLKPSAFVHGAAASPKGVEPRVQAARTLASATPTPAPAPAPASSTPATTPAATAGSAHPLTQPRTVAAAAPAPGQAAPSSYQRGEAIFTAHGCAACHGIGAVGTKMAPALMAFSKTVTPAALTALLQHPNRNMQAGGMPAVTGSPAELSALVAYLQHLGSPVTTLPGTTAATASAATAPDATTSPAAQVSSPAQSGGSVPSPGAKQVGIAGAQRPMNQLQLQGQLIFKALSCGTCHGMDGVRGTWAAPALANSGKNFPAVLLTTLLQHPSVRMQTGGMPPVAVSAAELEALAAYVSFISSQPVHF